MCGIFGVINTKKTKLDKKCFNVLGINNDSRGGDSCGIFIDGEVEYGVNTEKLYSSFFTKSKLLNKTDKCKIALGHCRKASVGAINEKTAQPVVLYDEEGKAEFVVIHNGTIYNYKELAAKYIPHIDITGLTDSQVMTRIFYYCGYDVLEEYYGGAAFVIVDYRSAIPQVLVFKGASRLTQASVNDQEERPFYFIQNDNTFIFSSISTYLKALTGEQCYSLDPNQLVEVKNDDVYLVRDINRKGRTQSQYYHYYTQTPSNGYNYYGDVFDSEWNHTENKKNLPSNTQKEEKKEEKTHAKVMVTDNGVYYRGDKVLHGMYNIDNMGEVYNAAFRNDIHKLWFWDGILLYGHNEFVFLKNLCLHYNMCEQDVKFCMPELLNYLSPYPISHLDYTPTDYLNNCVDSVDENTCVLYTGRVHRFLTVKEYIYDEGKEIGVMYGRTREESYRKLKQLIDANPINVSDLYKVLYGYDCN